MKVGLSLSRPTANSRISFGHNKGTLKAIETLQKDVTPDHIAELQVQLQDIEFTPDFVQKIKALSGHWKKFMVKVAPDEIQENLKNILGV